MACVRLQIDARTVAVARGILCEALREHGALSQHACSTDTVGDAVLMLSELVTNAVRHPRHLLLLEITITGITLHAAVVDDAPGLPAVHDADHQETGGRGLKIVDALADGWGFTPGFERKTVWFDLTLP
jgi:anti-sigma regulatory factor (Ser/Thr protein kinase)